MLNINKLKVLSAATLITSIIMPPITASADVIIYRDDIVQGTTKLTTQDQILNADNYTIGKTGFGSIKINNGSQINASYITLGYGGSADGTLALNGPGTNWSPATDSSSRLQIGYYGDGQFEVYDGAVASLAYIFSARDSFSKGSIKVNGQNSILNVGTLDLGNKGKSTLSIFNGATVNVDQNLYLGGRSSYYDANIYVKNSSTLNVKGNIYLATGYWAYYADLHIQDNATVNVNSISTKRNGKVHLSSTATLNINHLDPLTLTKIDGNGTINTPALITDTIKVLDDNNNKLITQTINNLTINMDYAKHASQIGTGYVNNGKFNVSNGVQISSNKGLIGQESSAKGNFFITGQNTKWTVSNDLTIGNKGYGSLTIRDSAEVHTKTVHIGLHSNSQASGKLTVSGENSKFIASGRIYAGIRNNGIIDVYSGQLHGSSLLIAPSYNSEKSTVTVNGQTALINIAHTIRIGDVADSKLIAQDNATINTKFIYFQNDGQLQLDNSTLNTNYISNNNIYQTAMSGTINRKGSIFDQTVNIQSQQDLTFTDTVATYDNKTHTVNNDLSGISEILGAGEMAQGQLNISNGMKLTSNEGIIGKEATAFGTVNIQNQNSNWTINHTLYVGQSGTGILNITNGGSLSVNEIVMSNGSNAAGTINIDGQNSTLNVSKIIRIGRYAEGALHINNNAVVNAPEVIIDEFGEVVLNGGRLNLLSLTNQTLNNIQGTGTVYIKGRIFESVATLDSQDDLYTQTVINDFANQNFTLITDLTHDDQTLGAGNTESGTLNILNGLQIKSKFGNFGAGKSSYDYGNILKGIGNISGKNTKWEISDTLTLGGDGTILTISDGATVITKDLVLGRHEYEEPTLIITGQGSSLTITGEIDKYYSKLIIEDGATLNTNTLDIYGNISLLGEGTTWNINDENLGDAEHQLMRFEISDKSRLNIKGDIELEQGTFHISGSNPDTFFINIDGDLDMEYDYHTSFIFDENFNPHLNQFINLINIQGELQGQFENRNEGARISTVDGLDIYITYKAGDGNDIALYTIPEPTTLFTILTLAPLLLTRKK